ncbi:MAG TPA: ribosome maturation factor RimM [Pseudomonadota bacterium]|jgi:16S rRNA processing protein RimM|nr:ribosome maturation factor RimM [Pseudomonadota bacterium]
MSSHLLELGVVCRPHGLRGELRVKLHNAASTTLESAAHVWTQKPSEPPQAWPLERCRGESQGFFVLSVDGIADRTTAEQLTGARLLVSKAELPDLEADEFYLSDLLGCEVVTSAGEKIGVAREILSLGAQPQLVIERPPRESALLPVIPEFVSSFDAERRVIVVTPPDGLFDLDMTENR